MGCILWVQTVIYTLPQSLQWCLPYHTILDPIIMALDCMYRNEHSIASGMNDECHNVKSNKRPQRFLASLANKMTHKWLHGFVVLRHYPNNYFSYMLCCEYQVAENQYQWLFPMVSLISLHKFRYHLSAVRQQAITWTNHAKDPWCHIVSTRRKCRDWNAGLSVDNFCVGPRVGPSIELHHKSVSIGAPLGPSKIY